MISKHLEEALNKQITEEYYSSYLYLAMSAYAAGINMNGTAHWLKLQAQEELIHAIKIFDYIQDRGGKVELSEVNKPPSVWESPTVLFEQVLAHEQMITQKINVLMNAAQKESDHATQAFLQWYVSEQVEEEKTAEMILNKFKLVGGSGSGLLMIDNELAARTLTLANPFTEASAPAPTA